MHVLTSDARTGTDPYQRRGSHRVNTTIKSRLAKGPSDTTDISEFRVLFSRIDERGRQACGSVLGHLRDLSPNTPFQNWCFNLPSGWIQENDGIRHLTRYAANRQKHDLRLAASVH